jgi:hypothetical protein
MLIPEGLYEIYALKNPKPEYRNPKQIQNPNIKYSKPCLLSRLKAAPTGRLLFVSYLNFGHLNLFGI